MAGYGAKLRPVATAIFSRARSTGKAITRFARPRSFSVPSDADAGAIRTVRNLIHFRHYYIVFLYIILLSSLIPRRHAAMLCLMATSKVAASYVALLKAFPNSAVLRFLDQRIVMVLFLMVIVVQMVITRAAKHLMISMAVGIPIVLAHAVFRARDDLAGEEAEPIADKKDVDLESQTE
ncbi:Prenylated rab acceptor PRA1 protein [Dioscorea alata]|uniref:Prenylated rab acceptor PRA1 protein n=1 Tax=Dioscorea alata TaxID=55571 RepID=A0ACB7WIG3_DIOAL|nr:Prenylated rab acceptor PRA1 protein [Dioscorea alata]